MTTRGKASILSALVAIFFVTLLSAPRATAASDEIDWERAFEKAKHETPGFAVKSVEEFRKLTDHYASSLSDGVTVGSFELPGGDQIRCVEISSQRSQPRGIRYSSLQGRSLPGTPSRRREGRKYQSIGQAPSSASTGRRTPREGKGPAQPRASRS